jgi:phosphotransferase system enzyme I (PtsI)
VFKTQLRALLRAAVKGNLRVMLPLVSTIEEVRAFNELMSEVADGLERDGVEFSRDFELGVMIEVPAAVMIAPILAREADFFSIGTNDLIQYAMAVDRNNDHVSHLYRPLHPAILIMIRSVIEAAKGQDIDVSVCGEMAADPRFAALLAGMGLRSLSMSPGSIPEVKAALRGLRLSDVEAIVGECVELASESDVTLRLGKCLEGRDVSTAAS